MLRSRCVVVITSEVSNACAIARVRRLPGRR